MRAMFTGLGPAVEWDEVLLIVTQEPDYGCVISRNEERHAWSSPIAGLPPPPHHTRTEMFFFVSITFYLFTTFGTEVGVVLAARRCRRATLCTAPGSWGWTRTPCSWSPAVRWPRPDRPSSTSNTPSRRPARPSTKVTFLNMPLYLQVDSKWELGSRLSIFEGKVILEPIPLRVSLSLGHFGLCPWFLAWVAPDSWFWYFWQYFTWITFLSKRKFSITAKICELLSCLDGFRNHLTEAFCLRRYDGTEITMLSPA